MDAIHLGDRVYYGISRIRALYRRLRSLGQQPHLRLLAATEIASVRDSRLAVYIDRSGKGLPSAKMDDAPREGTIPDHVFDVLCSMCTLRRTRYGSFPDTRASALYLLHFRLELFWCSTI